jgi:DNA polymerase elongation subunit (family B)
VPLKILIIDIETKPHTAFVWGFWDQRVDPMTQVVEPGGTICFAAKWYGKKGAPEFWSVHAHGLTKMVKRAHKLLTEADAVVHFNGTRFDIPTLNKEFLELGLNPPPPTKNIDLLGVCRKQFKFPSNKMDYVCQRLGIGGKTSHKGMQLWKECMNNEPAAWRTMERYNKQDVRLTGRLYDRLMPWIASHPNHGLFAEKTVCRNCGSDKVQKRGFERTALRIYQRYQCKSCGRWQRGRQQIPHDGKILS